MPSQRHGRFPGLKSKLLFFHFPEDVSEYRKREQSESSFYYLTHFADLCVLCWRTSAETSAEVGKFLWVPLCSHLLQEEGRKAIRKVVSCLNISTLKTKTNFLCLKLDSLYRFQSITVRQGFIFILHGCVFLLVNPVFKLSCKLSQSKKF